MLSRVARGVRACLRNAPNGTPAARSPETTAAPPDSGEQLTYDGSNDSPCPTDPILRLDACPVCEGRESTKVSRYNRFVLFDRTPDSASAIYDYSLCHG